MEAFSKSMNNSRLGGIEDKLNRLLLMDKYYFESVPLVFKFPLKSEKRRVDKFELDKYVTRLFFERNYQNLSAILKITQGDPKFWHDFEFAIGILLRPCILDSIYIMSWSEDNDLSYRLLADGFKKYWQVGDNFTINEFARLKEYFQPNEYSKISLNLDDLQKKHSNPDLIKELKEYYYMYSKYDHFTAIPFLLSMNLSSTQVIVLNETFDLLTSSMATLVADRLSSEHHLKMMDILDLNKAILEDGRVWYYRRSTNGA